MIIPPIILSFCNMPTQTTSPLLCMQSSPDGSGQLSFAPIALGFADTSATVTGLGHANGRLFAIFGSRWGKVYVSVLRERDLSPLFVQELPEVHDHHSVLPVGDCLYAVSTGTDELLCYDVRENRLENCRVVWRASDAGRDTHHINSVVEKDGEILVSAFGPKEGALWATSMNGYIYNVTAGTTVLKGIYHPHSLSVRNGRLYYSNSHSNTFCAADDPNPIFQLNGYTRGVTWLEDDIVCLATSIGRRVSKSTGLVANPADPGEPAGESAIWLGDITTRQILHSIDLSWFGPEVYDVLVLDGACLDLLSLSNASQIMERKAIQLLLSEIADSHQKAQNLAMESEAWQRTAADATAQLNIIRNSRAWRLAEALQRLRARLVPHGSSLARFARRLLSLYAAARARLVRHDA